MALLVALLGPGCGAPPAEPPPYDIGTALDAACTLPPAPGIDDTRLPVVDRDPAPPPPGVVLSVDAIVTLDGHPVDPADLPAALALQPTPILWAIAADVPGDRVRALAPGPFVALARSGRAPDPALPAPPAPPDACPALPELLALLAEPPPGDADPLCGTLRADLPVALRGCPDVPAALSTLLVRRGVGGRLVTFDADPATIDGDAPWSTFAR